MTNLDLSRLVTAETKAAAAREAHRRAAKRECRRRILSVADEATQMNLATALLVRHAAALRGGAETDCAHASGLGQADVSTVLAMRRWISEMRAACATVAADPLQPPEDDALWPAPPANLAALAARF